MIQWPRTTGSFARTASFALLIGALVAGAPADAQVRAAESGEDGTNPDSPHARPDACAACHDSETPSGPATLEPALCRDCHPRDRMYLGCLEEKAHPMGQEPKTASIPEGWPLNGGTVTCVTCHAEPSCGADRPQDPPYHRGGPYTEEFSLCYQCHAPDTSERSNPHHPDEWRVADRTCTACHSGLPARGAPPAQSRLRVEEAGVCETCHPVPLHLGSAAHLGKTVEALDGRLTRGLLALDAEGRMWCWTCHEVHGDGDRIQADLPPAPTNDLRELRSGYESLPGPDVLDELARVRVIEPPPKGPDFQPLLALPVDDGALCRACHGEGPR